MKLALPILVLLATTVLFGQDEGNIWYFGDGAGLDFNSGSPVPLSNGQTYYVGSPPPVAHNEASSVISNSDGELLFYSNGEVVWNKNHTVLPNGNNLFGGPSATQGALLVPKPLNTRYIYLFTLDDFYLNGLEHGLRYSVIDRCLDGQKGDIVPGTKNTLLLDYPVTEKLTAVRHDNGIDYWIVAHKYWSDSFYAFRLTSNGITDTVISQVGSIHQDPMTPHLTGSAIGEMKVSPDGSKLALCFSNTNPAICELFDFNNATGIVSNPISLQQGSLANSAAYGVAFSPDNTKLYFTGGGTGLFQFDLTAGGGISGAIKASMTQVANPAPASTLFGMQLGPDGKIYVSKYNESSLGVINDPNAQGASCNYDNNGILLTGECSYGAPGFITGYDYSFIGNVQPEPLSLTDTVMCKGDSIRLGTSGNTEMTFSWEPAELVNDSTIGNPLVYPEATTTFTVVSYKTGTCHEDTSEVTVTVLPTPKPGIIGDTFDICAGDTLQILSTGGNSYDWFPKSNILMDQTPAPKVFPDDTSLYELTIGYGPGCTWKDSALVQVNNGGGSLPIDTAICEGQAATLNASGYQFYEWTSDGNIPCSNCNEIIVQPDSTTNYTLKVAGQGCDISSTVQVTVNDPPGSSIMGPDTLCKGAIGYLEATESPHSKHQWQPALANSTTGAIQPDQTTTYYLTTTDTTTGCVTTDSHEVNVGQTFHLDVTADTAICQGSSVQLAVSSGKNVKWTPKEGLSCTNCSDPLAQPLTTTTYTVMTLESGACNDTAQVKIEVSEPPNELIPVDNAQLCLGDTLELQATGGNSYDWNPKQNITGANTATPEVYPTNTTTYTLNITYGPHDCPWNDSLQVNVIEGEGTLPTDTTICPGDSTTLTASDYQSYQWQSSGNLPCTNCSEIKVGPTNTTDYTLTATDQGGCEVQKTISVTVEDGPTITISGPDSLCAGIKDTLTASGVQNYQWYPTNGIVQSTGEIQPTQTTTYTVKATEACNAEATHQVVVKDLPLVQAENDTVICLGQSTPLTATGAENYQWSPDSIVSCSNCPDPIATPKADITYTVTGTGANQCQNQDSVKVDVSPNPIVTVPHDTTICKGDEIQIRALDNNQHEWEPQNEVDCHTCDTVTISPQTRTVFTVTAFGPESCIAQDTVVVDVQKPEISASNDTTVCPDDNFTLTATGAQTYEWQPTNETGPTIETSAAKSQTVTVTGFDNLSCTDTVNIQITVHDTIDPHITGDTAICPGEEVTWTITEGQNAYWPELDTNAMVLSFLPSSSTIAPGEGGSTLVSDQHGCTYERTKQLTLHPTPTLTASPDQTIRQYEELQLSASGASTYEWNPADWLSDTAIPNPTFQSLETGQFTYTVTGYNQYGCRDTTQLIITVEPELQIIIPNAFTPNGDGNNDHFSIQLPDDYQLLDLHIYDRWGNQVYTSEGQPWDGFIDGEPAPVATYVYVLRYEDDRGEVVEKQGNVTLVR